MPPKKKKTRHEELAISLNSMKNSAKKSKTKRSMDKSGRIYEKGPKVKDKTGLGSSAVPLDLTGLGKVHLPKVKKRPIVIDLLSDDEDDDDIVPLNEDRANHRANLDEESITETLLDSDEESITETLLDSDEAPDGTMAFLDDDSDRSLSPIIQLRSNPRNRPNQPTVPNTRASGAYIPEPYDAAVIQRMLLPGENPTLPPNAPQEVPREAPRPWSSLIPKVNFQHKLRTLNPNAGPPIIPRRLSNARPNSVSETATHRREVIPMASYPRYWRGVSHGSDLLHPPNESVKITAVERRDGRNYRLDRLTIGGCLRVMTLIQRIIAKQGMLTAADIPELITLRFFLHMIGMSYYPDENPGRVPNPSDPFRVGVEATSYGDYYLALGRFESTMPAAIAKQMSLRDKLTRDVLMFFRRVIDALDLERDLPEREIPYRYRLPSGR